MLHSLLRAYLLKIKGQTHEKAQTAEAHMQIVEHDAKLKNADVFHQS